MFVRSTARLEKTSSLLLFDVLLTWCHVDINNSARHVPNKFTRKDV